MTETRSPTAHWVTSAPTSRTSAENSWPRICGAVEPFSGCGCVGMTIGPTAYSCRSVPQMPHQSGRSQHLARPSGRRSATSSTRMSLALVEDGCSHGDRPPLCVRVVGVRVGFGWSGSGRRRDGAGQDVGSNSTLPRISPAARRESCSGTSSSGRTRPRRARPPGRWWRGSPAPAPGPRRRRARPWSDGDLAEHERGARRAPDGRTAGRRRRIVPPGRTRSSATARAGRARRGLDDDVGAAVPDELAKPRCQVVVDRDRSGRAQPERPLQPLAREVDDGDVGVDE